MEPWLQGLSAEDWPNSSTKKSSTNLKTTNTSTKLPSPVSSVTTSRTSSVKRNSVLPKPEFKAKDLFTPSKLENVFVPPAKPSSITNRQRSRSLQISLPTVKEVEHEDKTNLSVRSLPSTLNESSLLFSTNIADYPSEREVYPHRFREYVSRPSSPKGFDHSVKTKIPQPAPKSPTEKTNSPQKSTQEASIVQAEAFSEANLSLVRGMRKSLGTKDWMAEANKVMNLIRGQAQSNLTNTNDSFSLLSLTPLPDFTLHDTDNQSDKIDWMHPDIVNPQPRKTKRLPLLEDALVKAMTDAEPTKLYWEQIRTLSLHSSKLATLQGLKKHCPSLKTLDVTNNKISHVIDLPASLLSLNISSNCISNLTSWSHLYNLQTIDVSGNQLESLECFRPLIHLRTLNASNNQIRSIEGIKHHDGLISLNLSNNRISEIDLSASSLVSLETFDISNNRLESVKNFDKLLSLRHADMSKNRIRTLGVGRHKTVRKLTTLCVATNMIKSFDLTIFPSLQRLNIDRNVLTNIIGLAEADNLVSLSARGQFVSQPNNLINEILTTPHDCVEVNLSSNALPRGGIQLPRRPNFSLRKLELAACGLTELPSNFGDYFPNVRNLNLNFNALSTELLEALLGMFKLQTLLIAKNRINKMRRTFVLMKKFEALKCLDTRDNPLTVGFYDPTKDVKGAPDCFQLSERDTYEDQRWIATILDYETASRRAICHLLVANSCPKVVTLDGAEFDGDGIIKERETWVSLTDQGVLKAWG